MQTTRLNVRGVELRVDYDAGIWYVTGEGALDARTAEPVLEMVEALFTAGASKVCFDLRRIRRLSSAGIGVLLIAHTRATLARGGVVLIPPTDRLLRMIAELGMLELIDLAHDRDAARMILEHGSPYRASA